MIFELRKASTYKEVKSIEINTLEELLNVVKQHNQDIIIQLNGYGHQTDGDTIIIYDDLLE